MIAGDRVVTHGGRRPALRRSSAWKPALSSAVEGEQRRPEITSFYPPAARREMRRAAQGTGPVPVLKGEQRRRGGINDAEPGSKGRPLPLGPRREPADFAPSSFCRFRIGHSGQKERWPGRSTRGRAGIRFTPGELAGCR